MNSEKIFEEIYNIYTEGLNSVGSYTEKAQEVYETMIEILSKNGLSKATINGLCDADDISRIFLEVDELAEAGYKVDKKSVALFRLCESMYSKALGKDLSQLNTSQIDDLAMCSSFFSKVGGITVVAGALGVGLESVILFSEGKIDEAGEKLRKYGFGLLGGVAGGLVADMLIGSLVITNPFATVTILLAFGVLGTKFGEGFSDLLDTVWSLFDEAGAYTYPVDPLILDLDGDGIETVSIEDGVNFDFDNNGFAEKTGWVGKDDGLLVRDINGNGQIDNGGELFGDLTVAEDFTAENGFEALKYFDSNEDNIINHLDAIYSELRVWQDANQNGKVDAGELNSLKELGIAGLDLNYEDINETDSSGNSHTQKSTYIKEDGSVAVLEDVWFGKDASDTVVVEGIQEDLLEETEAISALPDIRGYGNQYSLHQAMLRDETGELQSLIEQYVSTEDIMLRKAMITNIIYVWTGVEDVSSTGRGSNLSDSRKLEALEVITGRDFESAYGSNPVYQAGQYIEQAFNKLVEMYYAELERQTTYAELYQYLYTNVDIDEEGKVFFDTEKVMEVLTEEYERDSRSGRSLIIHFVSNMKRTGFVNMIDEEKLAEQLAVFGDDIIHEIKYVGDDNIVGSDYDDDKLNGEMGDDTLQGGKGNDEYYFELGDGKDTIIETSGIALHMALESVGIGSDGAVSGAGEMYVPPKENKDCIIFGEGIAPEDVRVSRDSWNLYLTNLRSGDRICIEKFFNSTGQQVEEVAFFDGTKWDVDDLKDKARYYYGTEEGDTIKTYNSYYAVPTIEDDYVYGGVGDDTVTGNSGNDALYGEDGNDTISGGNGADTLVGGSGADRLEGGSGDDRYIFQLGDGQDTISENAGVDSIIFGEGIAPEDVRVSRDSWNLYLTNLQSGDRICIEKFFEGTGRQIEEVQFSDGSKWSIDALKDKARYYYGTEEGDTIKAYNSYYAAPTIEDDYVYGGAGDDTISGNSGNDELYGEDGNDTVSGGNGVDTLLGGSGADRLEGGSGDDRYIFQLGDGQDTISESAGVDSIIFGEGIEPEDVRVSRDSWNLYLTNLQSGDRICIEKFFEGTGRQIEEVQFSDGSKWSIDALKDKARYYYGTEEGDTIKAYNSYYAAPTIEDDYVYGGAGDDTISGNSGNDELYGEDGNDTVSGGNGVDALVGGSGADRLEGGSGDDRYIFQLGDGQDTISENAGVDNIIFGEGIAPEDVRVSRDSWNLYLTNLQSGDRICIEKFFEGTGRQIEEVQFSDGSKWSIDALKDKARYYYGTEEGDTIKTYNSYYAAPTIEDDYVYGGAGDDTISGKNGNDELYGEEGNDTISGGSGADTLVGGSGTDRLEGGSGDDRYIFQLGDGQDMVSENAGIDTIVFGDNIGIEDLIFSKRGNDLNISLVGQEDKITISKYYSNDAYKVESFQTADGSVLDYSKIDLMIQAMASFEDATGMMWEEAVQSQNEQTNDIINQWWTKE